MEANTIEILKECHKGCKLAVESMTQVMDKIKSEDLKNVIVHYNTKHKEIEEKAAQLLKEYGKEESEPGIIAGTFSWLSTEIKLKLDNDDKKIAKIMMDGCNMGIQSVTEYINKYTNASSDSIARAKKLVKLEESFMDDMKKFI